MVDEKNFAEMVDESLNVPDKGKLIKGTVIRIDKDDVFIDFGSKSEGIVAKNEFLNKKGELEVKIGDEVEVVMENWMSEGLPRLSRNKAEMAKETKIISECYESGELIKARVLNKVKGGLIADIGNNIEVKAFIPGSQIDIRPQRDFDQYVGTELEARVIKFSGNDIVLSRRVYLEEERDRLREKTLSTIEEGQVVSGRIVNIINQGVFVDIGGVEGFIPVSEVSWGRINHPGSVLSVNDEIDVNIIKIEEDQERITLSHKDTTTDPWESVDYKYKPGSRISGKVVSLTDFGVFVELEPGIEGLVHVSEITWTKRFRHPKEIVKMGSVLDAVVLDVNSEDKRISLSLRRIEPSPWQTFKENNPPGTTVKGIIRNVTDRGLFVEVAEEIVGLVRPDNISWEGRVSPEENYEKGSEIDVVVLNVDEDAQRIALGIKQLTKDPWDDAQRNYKAGQSEVTGTIKELKDRGIVVELENNIEGYIKESELSRERGRVDIQKNYSVGDEITALVTGFDRRKRQLNLSKAKQEEKLEKERVSDFISSQGESSVTLGDVLGKELKAISDDEVN